MKPEWCPQWAKQYADRCRELSEDGRYKWWSRLAEILDGHSSALLEAHQRGRREGLEDAALFLDKNMAGGAWVHAIRAKAQEVKT